MRLRSIHVVILIAAVVAGLVVYGAIRSSQDTPGNAAQTAQSPPADAAATRAPDSEDKFIEKARQLAQANVQSPQAGELPPAKPQEPTGPAPLMVLEPPKTLDLGTIPRQGVTTGEIKVHNKGEGTLHITKVQSSCGCTKAKIDEKAKVVPPGGTSIITVTADPNRIPGFESRKTVTVMSDDPKNPRVQLSVLAKIDPEFALEPRDIEFGEIRKGAASTETMVLRQLSDEPIEVTEVMSFGAASKGLQLAFEKRAEGQWATPGRPEYAISVGLPEDAPLGGYTGRFAIKTTCKRVKQITCSATAKITSFYSIHPPPPRPLMVHNRTQGPGSGPAKATITAECPFEISGLKPSTDSLVVAQKPGPEPNSVVIEVSLKPDVALGRRNETVEFTIASDEETFTEQIPVRVYVTRTPTPGTARKLAPQRPSVRAPQRPGPTAPGPPASGSPATQ